MLLPLICVLLLSFWAIKPLFHPGFFPMHDDTQVARVFEMAKSLKDGMFPVRWVSDLGYGYGYPIFNFYAPLAYYFGGFLILLGLNALVATKIVIGMGILLSGFSMYLLAKEFWGKLGGIVAATLYLYAPYHAVEVYVRGDIAEMWAYAFIPLAFYGLWKIYQTKKLIYAFIGAIGYAGIILSHNLSAMMTTPYLFAATILLHFFLYRQHQNKSFYLYLPLLFGILFSAFYWLPVLFEITYTNVLSQIGGGSNFHDHFVCISQLWNSPWGFAGSAPGCVDGISFRIGKIHLLLVLFVLSLWFFVRKQSKKNNFILSFAAVALLMSIFLTLSISMPIWNFIIPMAFFQFPWRFLIMISFFTSLMGGSIAWFLFIFFKKFQYKFAAFLLIIIIIFGTVFIYNKLFVPQNYILSSISSYTTDAMLRWTKSKISDEYLPKKFTKPKSAQLVTAQLFAIPNGSVQILENKTQEKKAIVTAKENTLMHIHLAYFPAWHLFIDGKAANLKPVNNGMQAVILRGQHQIALLFESTMVEQIANLISIASIGAVLVGIIVVKKRKFL